jgi:ATP phosphoribosyltransferase regulatory subunit
LLAATGEFSVALDRLAALELGGVLDGRIAALRAIAARLVGSARLTLDPTERHGFEYQSWFGFMIYAEGVRGALGRGGTYTILGPSGAAGEPATGFSLYPDPLIDALVGDEAAPRALFLPLGHDRAAAARLRAVGWRTLAALSRSDDAAALGCTHRLAGDEVVAL